MNSNRKYCTNCGNEMKLNVEICTNCGAVNEVDPVKVIKGYGEKVADVGKAVKKVSDKTIEIGKEQTKKIKESEELKVKKDEYVGKAKGIFGKTIKNLNEKGLLKKNNLIKMGIAIIAVLLLGPLATKEESKSEVVQKLQDAIIDNNIPKLEKIIKSSDKRLVVDEKVIKVLLSYYEENPSKLSTDMDNLLEGNNDYIPYRLEKRKGLFNEKYVAVLQTRFIRIEGEADNIEIQVKHGDDVIKTVDKYGEIGPLSPGVYTIEATLKNDYVTRKQSKEVDLFSTSYESENYIELFSDVSSIKVKSNKPEAILYINGKSTEKKIKDIKNIVGLGNDTKIYAVIKEGDKTLNSDVLEVYGDGTYELDFKEINEENIDEIIGLFIQNYEEGYQSAINEGDFKLVSDYLLEGSNIYYEYEENVELFYDKYIKRYLTSYNVETIDDLGNDTYKVVVMEDVLIDRDGEETSTEIKLICTIELIDGELYITEAIEE